MSVVRNTDPRRAYYRAPRSGRTSWRRPRRSVAAAGVLVALGASTLYAQGTFALWTDSANAQAGTFASGTFDITVDGSLAGAGGTITRNDLTLANMLPGESKAVTITVKDQGTTALTYDVYATGSGVLGPSLQVAVVPAATAGNATSTSGFRSGTCGTATPVFKTVGTTSTQVSTATRTLATGASESSCVIVRLDPDAPNSMQGKSGSGTISYAATQPTS